MKIFIVGKLISDNDEPFAIQFSEENKKTLLNMPNDTIYISTPDSFTEEEVENFKTEILRKFSLES